MIAISAVVGLALGYLGANVLFVGRWYSLVLWGLVALGIGAVAASRSTALKAAAAYGLVLVAAFMLTGYKGETAVLSNIGFLVLTLVLGVIGAAASMVAAWLAHSVRAR